MRWVYVNTGFNTAAFNMGLDVRLAGSHRGEDSMPVLRLYGWRPHAVSLGMHQSPGDFDLDKLAASGIDIIRRPTGGRAILHADELTYSVTMPMNGRSLRELYRFIHGGILTGLRMLGIDASFSDSSPNFRLAYQQTSSIPCFANSAKYEIQYQRKKLLGSAQRRFGGTLLQHGSLLLGPKHREIVEYLSGAVRGSRESLLQELDGHAVDLGTIIGRTITFEEASCCIREGFIRGCGIEFVETAPLPVDAAALSPTPIHYSQP